MEVKRLGNLDIHLILTKKEESLLELLTEKSVIATSKIKSPFYDPLNGKEVQLIYNPSCNIDGADGRDMIPHFDNPPIPVYIAKRGRIKLREEEWCGGAYLSAKIEIKVQNL